MIGSLTPEALRFVAETRVRDLGLDIIEVQWRPGDRDFDIIACGDDIMAGVHVVIARPEDYADDVTRPDLDRIRRIRRAADDWLIDHAFTLTPVRVDVLVLFPMLADLVGVAYIEGVAW